MYSWGGLVADKEHLNRGIHPDNRSQAREGQELKQMNL